MAIAHVQMGRAVVCNGPLEVVEGFTMLPIFPVGAVQLDLFSPGVHAEFEIEFCFVDPEGPQAIEVL